MSEGEAPKLIARMNVLFVGVEREFAEGDFLLKTHGDVTRSLRLS